jgi:Fe-S-cluster containining protein
VRVSGGDQIRWVLGGRTDIFTRLEDAGRGLGAHFLLPLQHTTPSGKIIKRCPFLVRRRIGPNAWEWRCDIESTKPDACGGFPSTPAELGEHEILSALYEKMARRRRKQV